MTKGSKLFWKFYDNVYYQRLKGKYKEILKLWENEPLKSYFMLGYLTWLMIPNYSENSLKMCIIKD